MDKKQTAIEWLIEQMRKPYSDKYIMDILDQAKSLEKQQIIEANEDCSTNELGELFTGEQYYNKTYEK